jgi:hypothetical protein
MSDSEHKSSTEVSSGGVGPPDPDQPLTETRFRIPYNTIGLVSIIVLLAVIGSTVGFPLDFADDCPSDKKSTVAINTVYVEDEIVTYVQLIDSPLSDGVHASVNDDTQTMIEVGDTVSFSSRSKSELRVHADNGCNVNKLG